MSLIAYEVLTFQPDFSEVPQLGIEDDRDVVQSPGGRAFVAWADRTDRVARFAFQTKTAEEWRILREFFDRIGGRAAAFYLPSWQHDFELAANAAAGSSQLRLAGHWFADNVTENRPDTLGRVIFALNHLGQFSTHLVASFGEDGADDVVALLDPITNPMEAGRTMVGFCYLARLTEDTIESEHLSPDHARMILGFRNVTQTRRVNQTESAEGSVVGNMNRNEDVRATDEDPIYTDPSVSSAIGPFQYGVPQGDNYQSEWTASLNRIDNTVTLRGTAYDAPELLYNAPAPADQIALTFDAGGREILAWDRNGKVTVAWFGPTPTYKTFDGFSPVAYNTYAIDSTVDAGTATIAVFYLREKDATIYCRIASENFTIEHRYCKSPLAPLYLHAARRRNGQLQIVGIDTGHRLAIWRSQTYVTPLEIQALSVNVGDVEGLYYPIAVDVPIPDEIATTTIVSGSIEFAEIRVVGTIPDDSGTTSLIPSISGDYVLARITGEIPDDSGTVSLTANASLLYALTAIRPGDAEEDSGTVSIQPITGTYST